MTTILQFVCPDPTAAATAQGAVLVLINTASRLQWLADDPGYVTQPFDGSVWHQHQTTPSLHWCDWGSIYAQLGDTGRDQANLLVGGVGQPGLLTQQPIGPTDKIQMELLVVADLVAAGYQAAPPPML